MVPHLINRQDATADHLSLRGDKVGEDQPRAVTEHQAICHIEGLHSEEKGEGGWERGREREGKREKEKEKEREKERERKRKREREREREGGRGEGLCD